MSKLIRIIYEYDDHTETLVGDDLELFQKWNAAANVVALLYNVKPPNHPLHWQRVEKEPAGTGEEETNA